MAARRPPPGVAARRHAHPRHRSRHGPPPMPPLMPVSPPAVHPAPTVAPTALDGRHSSLSANRHNAPHHPPKPSRAKNNNGSVDRHLIPRLTSRLPVATGNVKHVTGPSHHHAALTPTHPTLPRPHAIKIPTVPHQAAAANRVQGWNFSPLKLHTPPLWPSPDHLRPWAPATHSGVPLATERIWLFW